MSEHIQIGDTSPRIQYVGNGSVTTFTYPFPVFEESNLQIYLDAVPQTTGTTVTGVGETAGGTVIFSTAPALGAVVTLTRRLPEERTTDFQEGGAFRAVVINTELDRIVCMVQQLRDELSRSVVRPATSTATASLALPDPIAGRALKWNATGDALVNSAADPDAAAAAATAAQAAQSGAEAARDTALAALDDFDDRYLGAKGTDPLTDNDGNPLVGGALYFNAADGAMKLWTGATWVAAYVSGDGVLNAANNLSELTATAAAARGSLGAASAADLETLGETVAANAPVVVQVVEATPITTVVPSATAIPYDDTKPQIGEGVELMTATITPKSATNRLRIEFTGRVSNSTSVAKAAFALFQDSTADALAADGGLGGDNVLSYPGRIVHEMAAGTTDATTFRVRFGANTGTAYVNGYGGESGARKYGGAQAARLRVMEIAVSP